MAPCDQGHGQEEMTLGGVGIGFEASADDTFTLLLFSAIRKKQAVRELRRRVAATAQVYRLLEFFHSLIGATQANISDAHVIVGFVITGEILYGFVQMGEAFSRVLFEEACNAAIVFSARFVRNFQLANGNQGTSLL